MRCTSAQTKTTVAAALCFALFGANALALSAAATAPATSTPAPAANAQRTTDTIAAQARYESDKKLCNDETSSSARLQCRRDAKAEYDQAVAAAKGKSATAPAAAPATPSVTPAPAPAPTASEPACADCGRVMAVSVTQKAGDYSAAGVLAGGAIGAVLGNQVGGGLGKDLATIAGAVGGAYAGRVIEEKMKTHTVWNVTVHYANDSKTNFEFTADPGFQVGDRVKNSGNTIVRQ
jgi:outer membrane lipoprotein SlyB